MSAMRALLSAGVVMSPRGWNGLGVDMRHSLARVGAAEVVDLAKVQEHVRNAAVSELRLVPRLQDAKVDEVPIALVNALAPVRRISVEQWRALRPLDRYVLSALALNTRLLWRAVQEILPEAVAGSETSPWKSVLARCEMKIRPDALVTLQGLDFLDGRAFVLARVAGVRAARRAAETFDMRSDSGTGTIELDWCNLDDAGILLWQAHVSTWDGAFYPAAALAAATTAAIALCDMIRDRDPSASVLEASIVEDTWQVGSDPFREQATAVFRGKPRPGSGTERMIPVAATRPAAGSAPAMRAAQPMPAPQTPPAFAPAAIAPIPAAAVRPRASSPEISAREVAGREPKSRRSGRSAQPAVGQGLVFAILGVLVVLLLVAITILIIVWRSP
ncbi:MAG: Cyclic pyranopterin monophosphate synthase MoaC [Myxococcaceae bacterium]|nr:Cyclic pyranopterin monophosphate synthase MoaC [Myxococcaceae bacterium]